MDETDRIDMTLESAKARATAIRNMVRSLEARLSGNEWTEDGSKFIYTGAVLCGSDIIKKATGLLQPFCEESNLITIKQFETFSKQKYRVNSCFNATLMSDIGGIAKNQKTVMIMFMETLQNIGDIILGSKEFMKSILSKEEEGVNVGGL